MALTKKDITNLLKELSTYGSVLYYLVERKEENPKARKALSYTDFENLFYKENMEQVELIFPKIIAKIGLDDIDAAIEKYSVIYTKKECIKELLERHQDRYDHLHNIKDVALTEELAGDLIKENSYQEALNLYYMDRILKYLEANPKDAFLSTKERLEILRESFTKLQLKCDEKLMHNINQYYISIITE